VENIWFLLMISVISAHLRLVGHQQLLKVFNQRDYPYIQRTEAGKAPREDFNLQNKAGF
jgi:hypothetical protein